MRVSVVGASGRVGAALIAGLAERFEVVPILRREGEAPTDLAARAVDEVGAVVNAAGVAHVEDPTPDDVERLQQANVELPAVLAAGAAAGGASLVHISSVKATADAAGPYARSKRDGDERLEQEWADEFRRRDLSLVIVRPLALLFPPLDAGKVARLRFVRHLPDALTPPIPLPVLAPDTFVEAIAIELASIGSGSTTAGLRWRDFARQERGTLRDVRAAFRAGDSRQSDAPASR